MWAILMSSAAPPPTTTNRPEMSQLKLFAVKKIMVTGFCQSLCNNKKRWGLSGPYMEDQWYKAFHINPQLYCWGCKDSAKPCMPTMSKTQLQIHTKSLVWFHSDPLDPSSGKARSKRVVFSFRSWFQTLCQWTACGMWYMVQWTECTCLFTCLQSSVF